MPKTFRFDDNDIKAISELWFVGCARDGQSYQGAHTVCEVHGFKHRKTPDVYTMGKLIELYPHAPLQAWADIFDCTREAIRVLYLKISKGTSWGEDKSIRMFGEEVNMDKFNEFFEMFATDTTLNKAEVLGECDITAEELAHWIRVDDRINNLYKTAVEKRKHKKQFPTAIKCYRCGVIKELDKFGYSKHYKNEKSRTCNECNVAQVKTYMVKRTEEFDMALVDKGKVCPQCKEYKTRAQYNLSKGNRGGLQAQCIACQNKQRRKSPVRKQKFADAGFKNEKYPCTYCREEKLVTDFHLIRFFVKGYMTSTWKSIMSDVCTGCIDNFMTTLGDKTIKKPAFVQKYRAKVMRNKGLINVYDFVDELNKEWVTGRYDGI